MKKKIGLTLLFIIFTIFGTIYYLDNRPGTDQTYLLPVGFEGCVVINYNIKDAPALKIIDNEIVYDVPEDGIINTSSPVHFGWVNTKQSGAFQLEAYYVDETGQKVEQLPQDMIQFGANGSTQDGHTVHDYYYQLFGPDEMIEQGCP